VNKEELEEGFGLLGLDLSDNILKQSLVPDDK
jgi:hypothetical protein